MTEEKEERGWVVISKDWHTKLKKQAAKERTTMREVLEGILEDAFGG